jgi:excinuclease ABC subunit B
LKIWSFTFGCKVNQYETELLRHRITPTTIEKNIKDITEELQSAHAKAVNEELRVDQKLFAKNPDKLIRLKEKQMKEAVKVLDFETAAILRDELEVLRNKVADKSDIPL